MKHKEHWGNVAALKCCVCQGESTIHHCKGGSMIDWFGGEFSPRGTRCHHFLVIPLCGKHHTGDDGIDVMPVREWESKFGLQVYHLCQVNFFLYYSLWDEAQLPDPWHTDPKEYLEGLRETNNG